jgi:hypothetical protein
MVPGPVATTLLPTYAILMMYVASALLPATIIKSASEATLGR